MFQGEHGLAAQNFWIPVHPVTLVLLIAALIANWSTDRRNYIVATLLGYAAVLATTFVYFVPELLAITQTAYSTMVDLDLTRRANVWEALSLARLGFLIVLAIVLLTGLSKTSEVVLKRPN